MDGWLGWDFAHTQFGFWEGLDERLMHACTCASPCLSLPFPNSHLAQPAMPSHPPHHFLALYLCLPPPTHLLFPACLVDFLSSPLPPCPTDHPTTACKPHIPVCVSLGHAFPPLPVPSQLQNKPSSHAYRADLAASIHYPIVLLLPAYLSPYGAAPTLKPVLEVAHAARRRRHTSHLLSCPHCSSSLLLSSLSLSMC